ncbi:MAG: hypothetical protein M3Q78_01545 [Acidobacteriota bacterium]|nr:hypothetical protein [Acidobacteriota bacterium]
MGGQAVQAARLLEKLNQEPNIHADIQSIGPVFFSQTSKDKISTHSFKLYEVCA